MQVTITLTDADDKDAVSDLLTRLAAAISSAPVAAPISVVSQVYQDDTPAPAPAAHVASVVDAAPKKPRAKRADPVAAYNVLAASAGSAPVVDHEDPPAEVALAPIEEPELPLSAEAPVAPVVAPQDRKALEQTVLDALNKAGMAWSRANWPAGKPLRLAEFTDRELLGLRAKAIAKGAEQ